MSVYVALGENDIALDLAAALDRFAHRGNGEVDTNESPSALTALATSGGLAELITAGVVARIDDVLAADAETQNALFALTFALFSRLEGDELTRIVALLLPALTTPPSAAAVAAAVAVNPAQIRLAVLIRLFNLLNAPQPYASALTGLPSPSAHACAVVGISVVANVLQALLHFAAATEQANVIAASIPATMAVVPQWKLADIERAQILRGAYAVLAAAANEKADDFLYAFLKAIDRVVNDAAPLAQSIVKAARDDAATAALRAVSIPLAAINPAALNALTPQRLLPLAILSTFTHKTASASEQRVYRLLQIFAHDDIAGYARFRDEDGALLWMETAGLDDENNIRKLRTQSLCTLSATHDATLTIALIQEKLALNDAMSVHSAVIDAMISGRLDARIDESSGTVQIKRVVGSVLKVNGQTNEFGGERVVTDWSALQNKLAVWRKNMSAVLAQMHAQSRDDDEAPLADDLS